MFKSLVVSPFTVLLGLAFALGIGLLGGALIGACILLWPVTWLYDAVNERLPPRKDSLSM